MTSFNWTVSELNRKTADGFVYQAHWRCDAVDGDHSASTYSTASWSEGTPVVPYANLTQAQVLNWVWESVDKTATEASLQSQIDLQKNPVTATGLPWSQA